MLSLVGRSGSGKTTLIEALAKKGHAIVGEAAILVIEDLTQELGLEGQAAWRKQNTGDFQVRIIRKQATLEEQAAETAQTGLVFLDRGRPDGIAYCHVYERDVPAEVEAGCQDLPYDCVFLLDTLQEFDERKGSGRTSDRTRSLLIRDHLKSTYEERGFAVIPVPEMPVDERVDFVLGSLA